MLASRRPPERTQRQRTEIENLRRERGELPPDQAAWRHLASLRRDLDRRVARYEAREATYQNQIRHLEDAVVAQHDVLDPHRPVDPDPLRPVADGHRDLLASLDQVTLRRERVVIERRKDLEQAERARLNIPGKERDALRARNDDRDRNWKTKAMHFEKERDWAHSICRELETLNAGLETQNTDLRARKKAGDEDRTFLISQLAAVQRDNAKCKQALRQFARPQLPPPQMEKKIKSTGPMASVQRDIRTKELRKLESGLDHRQQLLLRTRTRARDHARESALLQKLVRDRLLDVRQAAADERAECDLADAKASEDAAVAKLEWTARVVSLLYDRAFPAGKS